MREFEAQLRKSCDIESDDAEAVGDAFHGLYEGPVLGGGNLYEGLMILPRPYRELAAAHQAWGIIVSDGFANYVQATDARFDPEVESGLKLTGHEDCYAAIPEARRLINAGALKKEDDKRLWGIFYDPIKDFHAIVGDYLLRYLKNG